MGLTATSFLLLSNYQLSPKLSATTLTIRLAFAKIKVYYHLVAKIAPIAQLGKSNMSFI